MNCYMRCVGDQSPSRSSSCLPPLSSSDAVTIRKIWLLPPSAAGVCTPRVSSSALTALENLGGSHETQGTNRLCFGARARSRPGVNGRQFGRQARLAGGGARDHPKQGVRRSHAQLQPDDTSVEWLWPGNDVCRPPTRRPIVPTRSRRTGSARTLLLPGRSVRHARRSTGAFQCRRHDHGPDSTQADGPAADCL